MPYVQLKCLPQIRALSWFVGESQTICRIASPDSVFMRANHSRKPNTNWQPNTQQLIANQPIAIGDEITFDYRLEIGPDFLKDHPPIWA